MARIQELETANAGLRAKLNQITGGVRTPSEVQTELLELREAVRLAKRMLAQLDAQDTSRSFDRCGEFRSYIRAARYIGEQAI